MRIRSVTLRLLRLPLVGAFETSFSRDTDRELYLVTLHGDGAEGWGECVAAPHPVYSPETNQTVLHILKDYLIPLYLSSDFTTATEIAEATAWIRGHNMAKAAMEMAWWDLDARQRGQSLAASLGATNRFIRPGVSIGIEPSIDTVLNHIEQHLAEGYARIKVKIKPGFDIHLVHAIRQRFGNIPLMVDANSAYRISDTALLKSMDEHDLMMIEQPLDHDDIIDHSVLQAQLKTPICLDESIHNAEDARRALQIRACRIINVKPGRVGGLGPSKAIHDTAGVPLWVGGMLETGVGRAHNVALAALPGFTLPGDTSASHRYYQEDIVDPPFTLDAEGRMAVPQSPGLGVTILPDRLARYTHASATF